MLKNNLHNLMYKNILVMNYYYYFSPLPQINSPIQQEEPSGQVFLNWTDILAGSSLLTVALFGILLHTIEVLTMAQLVRKVIGFRFFIILSIADVGMLLIFGIVPGLIVFFPSLLIPLTEWKRSLHILADTVWFACCYLNVVIAITRFACVVFPLHFRKLRRQRTCWMICTTVWALAFTQSWTMNSMPWFVIVWYAKDTFGMTCNWAEYTDSGTRTLYVSLNGALICAYLTIYSTTALIIFSKRALRFHFFATVLGRKGVENCRQNNVQHQQQQQIGFNIKPNNVEGANLEMKAHPKRAISSVGCQQQNDNSNQQTPNRNILIRTVSVMRRTSYGSSTNGSNSYGSGESYTLLGSTYSLELRLVLPCCVNSLIFVIGQLIIINGGIGPAGKWAELSIVLIFCLQSIAPPVLRFSFSSALRQQAISVLGTPKRKWKMGNNNGTNKIVANPQQQRQKLRMCIAIAEIARSNSNNNNDNLRNCH